MGYSSDITLDTIIELRYNPIQTNRKMTHVILATHTQMHAHIQKEKKKKHAQWVMLGWTMALCYFGEMLRVAVMEGLMHTR